MKSALTLGRGARFIRAGGDRDTSQSGCSDRVELQSRRLLLAGGHDTDGVFLVTTPGQQETGRDGGDCH
jgi:hypothetical protein